MNTKTAMGRILLIVLLAAALPALAEENVVIEKKSCLAPDGVKIVYSAAGKGEPALVFIHGGLADRTFYDGELKANARRHRVVALDLAGHGESGMDRKKWGIPGFGADVKAVADSEKLGRMVIFGNSLGGPVAIEAALLMPDRTAGVVGIDTLHRLEGAIPQAYADKRAEAFLKDYAGGVKAMLKMLFHSDADPKVVAESERRMMRSSPESIATAAALFRGLGGYDTASAAKRLAAPLRAINGDLYPTDVEGNRKIHPDFAVSVIPRTGHYPMLECPEEFHRRIEAVVAELSGKK